MKKLKRFLTPGVTLVLFIAAAALLLGSSIGGARAALTYFSETYSSRVQMYDIGVSLLENGSRVSYRDYIQNSDGRWDENTGVLLNELYLEDGTKVDEEADTFHPGVTYREALSVGNSGTINQYVRVSLYKYWLDENGEKTQALSPDLIDLNLINSDAWIVDESASTDERTVLYYSSLLNAGSETVPLSDTLTVDASVAQKVTQTETPTENGTIITTTYDYDGYSFRIEARVDAVQEHNAADAIHSAWGVDVNVSGGRLTLR